MIVRAVFTRDVYRRHARPVLRSSTSFTQARPPTPFIERLSLSLGDDGGKSKCNLCGQSAHASVEGDPVCFRCVAIVFASLKMGQFKD